MSKIRLNANLVKEAREILPEPLEELIERYLRILLFVEDDEKQLLNEFLIKTKELEDVKQALVNKIKKDMLKRRFFNEK
jgi:hypothetical protein